MSGVNVLHVIPSLAIQTGGLAVAAVELARVTAREGMETAVFATDVVHPQIPRNARPVAPEELVDGSAEIGARLFPVRRPRRLVYSPELRRALRDEIGRYDVVHIHSLYLYPQFAASREAARHGVPYVVSPHGALDPWLRRRGRLRKALAELVWQRRMFSRATAIHFTSDEEARLVGDVAPGVPRVIVPLGVRWTDYQALPSPTSFQARYLGSYQRPVVLNVGRLTAKKGLDVLIRSFSIVTRDFPDAVLVIAGPDDEGLRPELTALAEREGVADCVVFTGILHGKEKLAALASADVWALPSHTENFGIAVVEALAAGLATVISPAVNLAREIERSDACVVADLHPATFAEAIKLLLGDSSRRAKLGERAREFARRYDWEAIAPNIIGMYEALRDGEIAHS